MFLTLVSIALAYVFGSIPAGAWVAKTYGVDIKKVGSGGTGATNVQRALGTGPGLVVAFFDVFKGGIAVLIAKAFGLEGAIIGVIAVAAVLGHNYSCFLGFKGGKGVSTTVGTYLLLFWPIGLSAAFIGLLTMALGRLVSLGSMVGGTSAILLALSFQRPLWEVITYAVLAGLIYWTHKDNLKRLQAGTERRFGERVKVEPVPEEPTRQPE